MAHAPEPTRQKGLTFRFGSVMPFPDPDPWAFHRVEAFRPSCEEALGFLQVAHIPLEIGEALNQERLAIASIQGHHVFPHLKGIQAHTPAFSIANPNTWDIWKLDARPAVQYMMTSVLNYPWNRWNEMLAGMDNEACIAFVEEHRGALNKHTQPYTEKMFALSVHKASVDFVEVEPDLRGQGIGGMLYEAMARHLDVEFGLTLASSAIQNEAAGRCWEKLEHQGLAKTLGNGRKLFIGGIRQSTLDARDVLPSPMPIPDQPKSPGARM